MLSQAHTHTPPANTQIHPPPHPPHTHTPLPRTPHPSNHTLVTTPSHKLEWVDFLKSFGIFGIYKVVFGTKWENKKSLCLVQKVIPF